MLAKWQSFCIVLINTLILHYLVYVCNITELDQELWNDTFDEKHIVFKKI